ncbi:TonB-dependent receptor [Candidatus Desantisbacteria bacterium]|nr:TonB-dependent receptor [Candidatus Desantisbacteria bacterium]
MKGMMIFGLVMGFVVSAFASGTPTITVYGEEVVVTATRHEKGIGDVPVSVSVVTKEEMEKRKVTFVDEALKYEAGTCQRRTKFADTMSRVTLRGFSGGQRTLVLLDGTPINDAYSGGTYLGSLPIGNVQRIEVVKGPFSSRYGGEAMGGVINIITQMPEKEAIEVKSSASAFNTYNHILNYGNNIGRLSFSINLEKKTSQGDRTDLVTKSVSSGTAATKVSGWEKTLTSVGSSTYLIGDKGKNYWDQNHYGCKFKISPSSASNLSLSYTGGGYEYGYRDPQSYLITPTGTPTDNGTMELSGEGKMTISPKDFLSTWGRSKPDTYGLDYGTLIGGVALKGKVNLNCKDDFYISPETGATYHGGNGKLSKTLGNTLNADVSGDIPWRGETIVTVGLNYRQDKAEAKDYKVSNWKDEASLTGEPTYGIGGSGRLMAIYTQAEVEPITNLLVFLGARYDSWQRYDASLLDGTKSVKYADRDSSAFSPKVGLLYKCQGWYNLDGIRASWGKAFRPPTTYELYRTWVSSSGKTYAGNPELSPETTQSWEMGIDEKSYNLGLSFYRNAFDASCIWHFSDKIYANSNNSDVVQGVYGAYDTVDTVDMKVGYLLKENLRVSLAVDNLLDRQYYQNYKASGRTATFEVGCKY